MMAPNVQFKISGADQLLKNLDQLPKELRLKPVRSALGKAAKVVRLKAAENALALDDKETGRKIADNLIQRWRSRHFKRTGDPMISVGVGTEKGRIPKGNPDTGPKGNTPHWHLLELGTEQMPAHPFLRPAAEQTAQQAINTFGTELDKAIARIVSKLK